MSRAVRLVTGAALVCTLATAAPSFSQGVNRQFMDSVLVDIQQNKRQTILQDSTGLQVRLSKHGDSYSIASYMGSGCMSVAFEDNAKSFVLVIKDDSCTGRAITITGKDGVVSTYTNIDKGSVEESYITAQMVYWRSVLTIGSDIAVLFNSSSLRQETVNSGITQEEFSRMIDILVAEATRVREAKERFESLLR